MGILRSGIRVILLVVVAAGGHADFVTGHFVDADVRLTNGPGWIAAAVIALFSATGDARWLEGVGQLIDVAIDHFGDGDGGFFDTADDAQVLVRRPRNPADNSEPSGWFAIANDGVFYSALTGQPSYRSVAERALGSRRPRVDLAQLSSRPSRPSSRSRGPPDELLGCRTVRGSSTWGWAGGSRLPCGLRRDRSPDRRC